MNRVPSEPTNRRSDALRRLKISEIKLSSAPNITGILRETSGLEKLAFEAMRFSGEPLITKFLKKYDSIPERDRESLPLEAIALAAGVDVRHLWGEIVLAIRQRSLNTVAVVAMNAHPEVIQKRIEFAKTPGGYRDRDALDTMLGALPQPKGPTFIGKLFVGTNKEPEKEESERPEAFDSDDLEAVFPDCSAMQERVSPIRQKLLEK